MPAIKLLLLGTPTLITDGEIESLGRRKSIALLSYLAVMQQPQSRDSVATLLWPDSDQQRSRAALRTVIAELRKMPISNFLDIDRQVIGFRADDNFYVDIHEFHALMTDGLSANGQPSVEALNQLGQAVDLYRDDFLAGFTLNDSILFDEWQSQQTERFRIEMTKVLEYLVEGYQALGNWVAAIDFAQRWLIFDPLEEKVHLRLMQLYIQNGQRLAAMRQYEEYVRLLEAEIGVSPDDDIRQFYLSLRSAPAEGDEEEQTPLQFGTAPSPPPLVIGRKDTIDDIKVRLIEHQQQNLVIQGWPGVGKSTVVAALAHDSSITKYFPDGTLWVSLGDSPNIISKLEAWSRALGVYNFGQGQSIEDLVNQLTVLLRDKQSLLLVDDVWDIEHAVPFQVGGADCVTLITTRFNDVANALAGTPSNIYKLPVLTTEKGVELLRALAPTVSQKYPHEMRELVYHLEGLPLALQVAGRLLHAETQMGWGIQDLLGELQDGTRLLEAQAPPDRLDLATSTTPTVAVLLQKSTDRLNEETRERFALLGIFAPKPATFDLPAMAAVWDIDDPKPTARMLVNRGLLEPIGDQRFQMHALLALHAKTLFTDL